MNEQLPLASRWRRAGSPDATVWTVVQRYTETWGGAVVVEIRSPAGAVRRIAPKDLLKNYEPAEEAHP